MDKKYQDIRFKLRDEIIIFRRLEILDIRFENNCINIRVKRHTGDYVTLEIITIPIISMLSMTID